jgi:hypothetical protein
MNRGENIHKSIPGNCGSFWAAVIGAGAAAPTVPANGTFTPTTATFPVSANGVSKVAAEVPTRSGTGVYVLTLSHLVPLIMFATGVVVAAGGAPTTALAAEVTSINASARQVTVKVFTPAGVATDLGTSDMLLLKCDYHNSNA